MSDAAPELPNCAGAPPIGSHPTSGGLGLPPIRALWTVLIVDLGEPEPERPRTIAPGQQGSCVYGTVGGLAAPPSLARGGGMRR